MFKTIMGFVIGYGVFNEKGRKLMNDMGNAIIKIVEKKPEKTDIKKAETKVSPTPPPQNTFNLKGE